MNNEVVFTVIILYIICICIITFNIYSLTKLANIIEIEKSIEINNSIKNVYFYCIISIIIYIINAIIIYNSIINKNKIIKLITFFVFLMILFSCYGIYVISKYYFYDNNKNYNYRSKTGLNLIIYGNDYSLNKIIVSKSDYYIIIIYTIIYYILYILLILLPIIFMKKKFNSLNKELNYR